MNATKTRYDADAVIALLAGIDRVVASRGRKVESRRVAEATEEELLALLLGPTGNLRAPAARVGRTLIVGFHPEAYDAELA